MPGLKTRIPSLPLSNCNLCRSVRKRERCSSARLTTSELSGREEPLVDGGGGNAPLRGARHGASRVITDDSAAPPLTAHGGGAGTLRASARASCSNAFAFPKTNDVLRRCSATCGRAPSGRGGDRGRDDDDMSVPLEDDWGFASRASRERIEPPKLSELLLFSPATSGPGRLPLPLPLALLGPRTSFRETTLEPDASPRFWFTGWGGWYGCPVTGGAFRRPSSCER
ncbi:hypothetical protein EV363DRAFT_78917 [Boletus edulis]|nr:hypothetical protein EV363DRAFT_78917 [Boletus edulis]